MSNVLAHIAAASSAGGGGIDWIRIVGIAGIMGVWTWRGLAAVARSRGDRPTDAPVPADTAPDSPDDDDR